MLLAWVGRTVGAWRVAYVIVFKRAYGARLAASNTVLGFGTGLPEAFWEYIRKYASVYLQNARLAAALARTGRLLLPIFL